MIQHYAESNILIVNVPRNMTKYYQPLDLTVNGYSKRFLKNKFNEWYSFQVSKQLAECVMLENVQVKLNLTILKPIHAGWLVDFYNHMTTDKGFDIIKNGWKAAGTTNAIRLGLNNLPSVDPFDEMDPMLQLSTASADQNQLAAISRITLDEIQMRYPNPSKDNSDENDLGWEDPQQERAALDLFDEWFKYLSKYLSFSKDNV